MAALTREQKRFIVERLACYDTPQQVADAAKTELGLEIRRQHVGVYDASKPHIRERMGKELIAIFDATRERFKASAGELAIAQKAYRLTRLQRMSQAAEDMGNLQLAAQLLEQAAKDVGNAYTNHRTLSGPGGGPVAIDDMTALTPEEQRARIHAFLDARRAARGAPGRAAAGGS